MIDSGANADFISESIVQRFRLPTTKRKVPLPLSSLNGVPYTEHGVKRYAIIVLSIQGHHETIALNVVPIHGYSLVLGRPWLRKHDPLIRWSTDHIQFNSEYY
jgi:Retroviral aspartyl protease